MIVITRNEEQKMLKANAKNRHNHPSDVTNDFITYVFKREQNNMTAMERFKNELKEHLGQEKLILRPELQRHLVSIYQLQYNFYNAIISSVTGTYDMQTSYITPFLIDINKFLKPLKDFLSDDKCRLNQSDKPKDSADKVVDGAYFINFMNVANQLYLYENYYLNNIPKEVKIEFLYEVTKAKDILNNYGKELIWVEKHSSYDHTLSIFDFDDPNGADGKLPTKEILDKSVSK